MLEYQLSRPDIDTIIDYCNDLLPDEELTVFEFGENNDLVLHFFKDEEFDPSVDPDYSNLVDITTYKDGNVIDDAVGIYVTDGELCRELLRINNYNSMNTL